MSLLAASAVKHFSPVLHSRLFSRSAVNPRWLKPCHGQYGSGIGPNGHMTRPNTPSKELRPASFPFPSSLNLCRSYCRLDTTMPPAVSSVAQPAVGIEEHRLPLDVKPVHYDLTVRTDLKDLKFDGSVVIDLEILKETPKIVFHSTGLNLSDAIVSSDGFKTSQAPASQSFEEKSERAILDFSSPFAKGTKLQLKVKFDADLTGNMMGYYYSSWEKDGQKQYYTLTQFEPTAARRAFPCWDEPLLKATYTVTLISRENTVNLSNMSVISEEPYHPSDTSGHQNDNWKITKFERTPKMSSYLVAYANGEFEFIEDSYVSPLSGKTRPLRVYATSDWIQQAEFALEIKKKVLPLYEQMFDIEYPLPKLDTLIVNDFDAGAMENWGLITGRTTAFCLKPGRTGIAAKKRVATVQSHECAHMWFGDITTMAWWDNLYLNEGFATLMGEVIIIDKIFPEWKVYSEFINDHLNRALDLDAKKSSHPIEVDCPDANQVNQIFDALSYSKAGSVLRMLSAFVGEETFLRGVSIYLKRHLYGNSVSKDLWDGISEAAGMDVTTMMNTWVSKIGFPMVTVTKKKDSILVRQDRFLETGPASEEDNQTIWQIPLNIASVNADGKLQVNQFLLKEREATIPLNTDLPFKMNYDTTGVYRVLYEPDVLDKTGEEAAKKGSIFSLNDRMGLVNDVYALSNAGFQKVSSALALLNNLRQEEEYLVWSSMLEKLGNLMGIFWENEKTRSLMKEFRLSLCRPLVEKLGFSSNKSDSADTIQLRTLVISGAAADDDPNVVAELTKNFADYFKSGDDSKIPTDLERVTYKTTVRHGGRSEYDAMKSIYAKPKTPTQQTAAAMALCSTKDPQMIDETFKFILDGAKNQDVYIFVASLAANRATRRRLATFLKDNYDEIYKRFSTNTQLSYIIRYAFEKLSTESDAKDTETFFKDKDVSKFNLALQQAIDTIRTHDIVIQRSTDDIIQWLENWGKKSKI